MTFDIHVHTQYRENYGDDERPYWKNKGGDTFVIDARLLSRDGIGQVAERMVNAVRSTIEYHNNLSVVDIIDWELVPTGTLTPDERDQMEFDGKITCRAQHRNGDAGAYAA